MPFAATFAVPDVALGAIERFVTRTEMALIEHFCDQPFSAVEAADVLSSPGGLWAPDRAQALLEEAYRRGVLRKAEGSSALFRAATFAERLEILVVGQPEEYEALDASLRAQLDAWSFATYLSSLGPGEHPTSDRVATLERALAAIDAEERPIWLNTCDCRVLAGRCEKPRQTCITFRNGINTTSDRGWSRRLTRAEAKEIVRRANAAGLMQTVNDDGICNCCADCCYLFRAQEARQSAPKWPWAPSVASLDVTECIACGLCEERCPFGVFELEDDGLRAALEHCRGCGLCVETCPTEAISLTTRREER